MRSAAQRAPAFVQARLACLASSKRRPDRAAVHDSLRSASGRCRASRGSSKAVDATDSRHQLRRLACGSSVHRRRARQRLAPLHSHLLCPRCAAPDCASCSCYRAAAVDSCVPQVTGRGGCRSSPTKERTRAPDRRPCTSASGLLPRVGSLCRREAPPRLSQSADLALVCSDAVKLSPPRPARMSAVVGCLVEPPRGRY